MTEKISLYIPSYNAGDYIKKCLDGVFSQTYPIDEVFVVDDGPGSRVADIARGYPVNLIQRSGRRGLVSARNLIFTKARNEFIAGLDADCQAQPYWLENLMMNFTGPEIAGVGGKAIEKFTVSLADKWREARMSQNWGEEKKTNPGYLYGCNTIHRKSSLAKIGFYNEEYTRSFEDVDVSLRLKRAGYTIIYEPKAVVCHLRRDNIRSVLATRWIWTFVGWQARRPPHTLYNLCCKTYDNFFIMCGLVAGDLKKKTFSLIFLDALFFWHHLFLTPGIILKKNS